MIGFRSVGTPGVPTRSGMIESQGLTAFAQPRCGGRRQGRRASGWVRISGAMRVGTKGVPTLRGCPKLLADYSAQRFFQGVRGTTVDVLAQRGVDQCLVITTAGLVDLLTEPVNDLVVEEQLDFGKARRSLHHGTALAGAEVVRGRHRLACVMFTLAGIGAACGDESNDVVSTISVDNHQLTRGHERRAHPTGDRISGPVASEAQASH